VIAVVQRVRSASVTVAGEAIGAIEEGLLILLGCERGDGEEAVRYMARKVVDLRIFEDHEGKMNRSVLDVGGAVLAVSQFTLLGETRKGRRPSFVRAAPPEEAEGLFLDFIDAVRQRGVAVESGRFGARMLVRLENDGPVTIIVESPHQEGG
jgi:D-tyrosyl-tRNA(Tyr) deacylase